MGFRRRAKNLRRDYGDFAELEVAQAIARAEGIEQTNRITYWRKVLDALNKLPSSSGKQTKEK